MQKTLGRRFETWLLAGIKACLLIGIGRKFAQEVQVKETVLHELLVAERGLSDSPGGGRKEHWVMRLRVESERFDGSVHRISTLIARRLEACSLEVLRAEVSKVINESRR